MRAVLGALVTATLIAALAGCGDGADPPDDALPVGALLENPVYESEVTIYGEVEDLGELLCPCFTLRSGDAFLAVWYDLMVEDDGTERPAVDVSQIANGDEVLVTGELLEPGGAAALHNFWASAIEPLD